MKKRIIAIITGLAVAAMVVGPGTAQAATLAELEVLIAELTQQLADARDQLIVLQGGEVAVTGCTITSFDRNLKQGMTGDDVKCLQIVLNTASDTQLASSGPGSPGSETSYFGPLTKAAVIKFQEKYTDEVLASWGLTTGTGFVGTTTRAKLNELLVITPTPECTTDADCAAGQICQNEVCIAAPECTTDADCPEGYVCQDEVCTAVVVPPGEGLTVALAADTPVSSTLVTGQALAPLAKYVFTNGDNAEVKINKLKLKRLGVSADATLANVYLFEGANRLTDSASVSSGVITFSAGTVGLFEIAAGSSRTITVYSDVATGTSGETVGVGINAADDVTTDATSVNGTFPMNGNLNSIASGTLAGVNFNAVTTPNETDVDPQDDYVVWQNTITVTTRAVELSRISFREIGTVSYSDLQNFRLYVAGLQVGSAVANLDSNGYVTFDLSAEPKRLEAGAKQIKVLADIIGGSSRTFKFSLRTAADATFTDTQYNVNVLAKSAGGTFSASDTTTGVQTINPGTITITKLADSPVDVILGNPAETLAEFEIKAAGERVKIETLTIGLTVENTTSGNDDGTVTLRNGMLLANDVQIGSTKPLTEKVDVDFPLGSSLIVEPGSPVTLKVIADIYDEGGSYNDLDADDTLKITIVEGDAQGMVSLTSPDVPSKDGNTVTIETGDLRLAKYAAYTDKALVAPVTAAKLAHFTLTCKDEAVNINTITVNLSDVTGGLDVADDLSNLYVAYGDQTTTVRVTPATGNNSWSINYELAKHEIIDVIVYADVASTADENSSITSEMEISGITVESAESVDDDDTGQTITFGAGQIIVATDGGTPLDMIVSGSTPADLAAGTPKIVIAAKFKFTAVSEGFDIKWVAVTVGKGVSGVISRAIAKDGDTVLATSPFNRDKEKKARLYLDPDLEIPANTKKVLTIALELAKPSANASTSQVNAQVTLDEFKYATSQGVEADTEPSDVAGNDLYVYQSIPTFTQEDLKGTYILNGTKKLYEFKVAADDQGPISVKQLKFDVVIADAGTASTPALSAFKLLKGSTEFPNVTIQDINGDTLSGEETTFIVAGTNVVVVTFDTEETIAAGQSQSYTLKATASGFAASTTGNDSVAINLKGEVASDPDDIGTNVYLVGTEGSETDEESIQTLSSEQAVTGTDYNVIWSDESAIPHEYESGASSNDWTNGTLVLNLPLDAQSWVAQ